MVVDDVSPPPPKISLKIVYRPKGLEIDK